MMTPLTTLSNKLMLDYPEAVIQLQEFPSGCSTLSFSLKSVFIVADYDPKEGFGVSDDTDTPADMWLSGHDNVFTSYSDAESFLLGVVKSRVES